MFLDWLNVHWADIVLRLLVIWTDSTSKVFYMCDGQYLSLLYIHVSCFNMANIPHEFKWIYYIMTYPNDLNKVSKLYCALCIYMYMNCLQNKM